MSEDGTPTLPQVRLAATLASLGFRRVPVRPDVDEAVRVGRDLFRVTCSTASMRTRVSVTALSASRDKAEEAIGRAFEALHLIVPLLNRHDGASAISALNDQGAIRSPPTELIEVLNGARRIHALTEGSFDPTVKPLVDMLTSRASATESGAGLAEALDLVDMSALDLSDGSVRLQKEGMGVTLDGIAKGYVVDHMASVLEDHGMRDWLIDAGGDIRASGKNERGRAWRLGVQDPDKGGRFPEVMEVHDGAVATSGGYESFYAADQSVHHIVDSSTGRSPTYTRSASVAAPTAMIADALATAVLVMQPGHVLSVVGSLPGCSCLLLDAEGRRLESDAWSAMSSPLN